MIDVSSARVSKLIVHRIGNKIRDEGYTLSQNVVNRSSTLDDLILRNYLAPVLRQGEAYDLTHESDIALNTVHHFANKIFADSKNFKSHSQNIAKHLYSASIHPNIGGGEFIVILFEDIRTDDGPERALGLFRIEGKNDYLDIEDENGSLQIVERSGISLDKIQKGAVVISGGVKVFVIDSLGQKTKYWLENFLKAVPAETPQACAKAAGAFLKSLSTQVDTPERAFAFGQQVQNSISENSSLTIADIKEISSTYIAEEDMERIFSGIKGRTGLDITDDIELDTKQLAKYARDVMTKARIAEGINLIISNQKARVSAIDVRKTKTGLRATIDIQLTGE